MSDRPAGVPEGYGPTGIDLIKTGEEAYIRFATFTQWVNMSPTWMSGDELCFDTRGRQCFNRVDMMRARDEDAFPVTVARRMP